MQLPKGYTKKYQKLMGSRAAAFLRSFSQAPLNGFRVNPLKATIATEEDLSQPVPWTKWGYYGKVHGRTIDHQSGAVYSQEPSAMYVGTVMNPRPDERVLDLCAAPGGKTTSLASLMHNHGLLVANDIVPKRAKVLVSNLERFGVRNALVTNESPSRLVKPFREYFDRILVDAPCSGEGMFRKNPQAMKYWLPGYPSQRAKLQKQILRQAMKMLRPGGTLVYSTCTFSPEEDEQVVAWLLDHYAVHTLPIHKFSGMVSGRPDWANRNPQLRRTVRLFPNLIKGEGHFIAKVQLSGVTKYRKIRTQRSNVKRSDVIRWRQFSRRALVHVAPKYLIKFGPQLYAFNPKIPQLRGLNILAPGLHLGTLKKHRFEPSYALALALHPNQVKRHLQISVEQWKHYVHGETLSTDPNLTKGWYQLICKQQPIAFGKVVQGTVKNFFPKGLRFLVR